ncbi:MAG: carbohydrate porin [Deltaproteobacteria bacterium]|nr:carbohydrate porin [Deltaproteobacteria bacterium]
MKKKKWLGAVALLFLLASEPAMADQAVSREEIETLKEKLKVLEETVGKDAEPHWYDKIDLSLDATGVVQGTVGVKDRLRSGGDLASGTLNVDLEATAPIVPRGSLFVHFKAGAGKGLDGDIPSLNGFNNLAVDNDNARLWEVWYEHRWLDEKLRFRVGKVDLTTDFDTNRVANDDMEQFLSKGFVNNSGVEFPDQNGPGAMLWLAPHPLIDLGVGVADAGGNWENIDRQPFVIAEIDFKPRLGERQGNYRFYGWFNGKDHREHKDAAKTQEPNAGFGFSFDQELTEAVTAFARYARQTDRVATVSDAWSTGLEVSGKWYGRENDALGAAYGMALLGKDFEAVSLASGIDTGHEQHAEVYYRWRIHEHLDLSPHVQWVKSINGDRDNADVWAFGLRAHLDF